MSQTVSISDIWAQEEMDTLYWYYVQSKKCPDVVGKIIKHIKESGQTLKSRIAVIQQLLQQDIINLVEFDSLMKFEDSQYEREARSDTGSKGESGVEVSENSELSVQVDDIKVRNFNFLEISVCLTIVFSDFARSFAKRKQRRSRSMASEKSS